MALLRGFSFGAVYRNVTSCEQEASRRKFAGGRQQCAVQKRGGFWTSVGRNL